MWLNELKQIVRWSLRIVSVLLRLRAIIACWRVYFLLLPALATWVFIFNRDLNFGRRDVHRDSLVFTQVRRWSGCHWERFLGIWIGVSQRHCLALQFLSFTYLCKHVSVLAFLTWNLIDCGEYKAVDRGMIFASDTIFGLSVPTKSLCWEVLLAVPLFKFFGSEIRIVSRLFRQSLLGLQLWHITIYAAAPVLIILPVNWGLYFFRGAFSYRLAHRLTSFENAAARLLALRWQALRGEFDLSDLFKTGCTTTLLSRVWRLLLSHIVVDLSLLRAWIGTDIRVFVLRGGHDLLLRGLNLIVVVELI